MRSDWPLWSLVLLLAGSNLSTGNLNDRVVEFFKCMATPRSCLFLHIDDYSRYYLLAEYNDSRYRLLLNDFDNLFGFNGKVRLNHIQGLNISSTMREVKRSAFSSVKSLRNLSLANNFIERVDRDAFMGLNQLRELVLSENFIESLPLVVFDKLPKLQRLSLANNKITVLNFNHFEFNQQLVSLDVSSNELTSLLAPKSRLGLRNLLLAHNHLNNISVVEQLPQLTSLDVSGNELYDLGTVNFRVLGEIDISQNLWDCKYLSKLLQYFEENNISTRVRETKTEVYNSPNVNRIGCSETTTGAGVGFPTKICGQAAIRRNEPVQTVRLPWMVTIYRQQGGSSELHCTGSLVSNKLVVTAAHCIYLNATATLSMDEIVLFVGRYNILEWIKRDSEIRSPSQFIVHPEYVDLSNDADIALILMSQPVAFTDLVQPICLPTPKATTTVPLLLTTYVKDEFKSLMYGEPRTLEVPTVSSAQCSTSGRTVCVGGKRWRGPCNIDSGAALIGQTIDENDATDDVDQRWYLNGVQSSTLPDPNIRYCNLKRFTVFTKVAAFSEWIAGYIAMYS